MMRWGGSVSIMGMKAVVVGRQMASGLLLHEIKQKYMLKTCDASQIAWFCWTFIFPPNAHIIYEKGKEG